MSRWFMGTLPGVGAAVRVTKDNADDPKSIPSSDWQKLAFDSQRAHKLGYVYDIREISHSLAKWPKPAADNTLAAYYEPAGSNDGTAAERVWTQRANGSTFFDNAQSHVIFPEKLGFSYTPIIEGRYMDTATNRFEGVSNYYRRSTVSGSSETGYVGGVTAYVTSFRDSAALYLDFNVVLNRRHFSLYGFIGDSNSRVSYSLGGSKDLFSILELPAGNEAMPAYAGTPAPGQKLLRISSTALDMAYPGHDVSESSHEARIFSGSRIPAKLIGAGEVQVNSGANVKVFTKRPTTLGTYMDYMVRRTSDAMHHPPFLPTGTAQSLKIQMEYVIEADGVRIYNTGNPDIVVRYMILADDDSANTTGGAKVFHKGNDGTVDFIQLKRPGSSDVAPALNDIILDTRLPYLPIVDEGWLPASSFNEGSDHPTLGNAKKTIWFANSGFMPFVKYLATWSDGSIRAPVNRILRSWNLAQNPRYDNVIAGCTTNCRVSSDKLEFYHASGQAWSSKVISGHPMGTYADPVYGPNLVGIRWYLFAIPNSL